MLISRAGLLRAAASLALPALAAPALARASTGRPAPGEAFRSNLTGAGPRPWTAVPAADGGPLRFAVVGDNTGIAKPGVFDQAMRQIGWLEPDFIITVGDLIEGYSEDRREIGRQWAAIDASIAHSGRPFLFTPGNHDIDNAETLDAWRERRGAGYYAFTYKGALFLVLNTEDTPTPMTPATAAHFYSLVEAMRTDPDQAEREAVERIKASATGERGEHSEYASLEVINLGDKQLGFVRDTLARHPHVRWTFVILHKPAWKMRSDSWNKVQAMLRGRPHTVFAGHTHYFTHDVFDGNDYINMASTGGIRHKNGPGTMDHAMVVTLGDGPIYANTRLSGLMDVAGETGQVRAY
ncbi:MAG TPA: metallophosphoesterase [Caulobacteraceae bacterium]|jgi:UDP-2,3-diacylglucosamine pyrophosphatase LpxH|nr:metallophosphoesterase [Caulobacteraceae bacterium]